MESEITKNDICYRTLTKYMKSITAFFDKYKKLKEIPNDDNRIIRIKEFMNNLKDFKRLNLNMNRKYDNMNSLTLKSEYSDDGSEMNKTNSMVNLQIEEINFSKTTPGFNPHPQLNSYNSNSHLNSQTQVHSNTVSQTPSHTISQSNSQSNSQFNTINSKQYKNLNSLISPKNKFSEAPFLSIKVENTISTSNVSKSKNESDTLLTRVKTIEDKISKPKNVKRMKNKNNSRKSNPNSDLDVPETKKTPSASMNLTPSSNPSNPLNSISSNNNLKKSVSSLQREMLNMKSSKQLKAKNLNSFNQSAQSSQKSKDIFSPRVSGNTGITKMKNRGSAVLSASTISAVEKLEKSKASIPNSNSKKKHRKFSDEKSVSKLSPKTVVNTEPDNTNTQTNLVENFENIDMTSSIFIQGSFNQSKFIK